MFKKIAALFRKAEPEAPAQAPAMETKPVAAVLETAVKEQIAPAKAPAAKKPRKPRAKK